MSTAATITVAVTILLAGAGYLATYASSRVLAQRAARLERINKQLSELYGPLLADLESGNAAWQVFQEIAKRSGPMFWDIGAAPNPDQTALWQLWITTVFQPTNRQMTECIKTHAALLIEDDMPACLIRLAANTAAYDVLASRWGDPDFTPTRPEDLVAPDQYTFPRGELETYARSSFQRLKADQQDLLGKLSRGGPAGSLGKLIGQRARTRRS